MSNAINFNQKAASPDPNANGSRRSFLKYGGASLATAGILLSGCEEFYDYLPQKPSPKPDEVSLGSGDIGILNYAYALEQLEAAFYTMVISADCGFSDEEYTILMDLYKHEVVHREFFKAVLAESAIPALEFDFSAIDFSSRSSILGAAKTFEDLGVAAYNGAGKLLENPDFLLIAGKIVSVEARHAAAIRSVFDDDPTSFAGDDVIDENGLDRAFTTDVVLQAASDFIVTKIDGSDLPTS